jgi:hypothetical protein
MKKIVVLLLLLMGFSPLCAQHITFKGLELGGNPEMFSYELKGLGFIEGKIGNYPYLVGDFLRSNCKVFINEENGLVSYLFIDYRFDEDFSKSKADNVAKGVVEILIGELSKLKQRIFVYDDVPLWGSVYGTRIDVKHGWYEIMIDGSRDDYEHKWRVIVRVFDFPNNPLYASKLNS